MSMKRTSDLNLRIQRAIDELKAMIKGRFPDASFDVYEGDDPSGTYLRVTVDIDDTDEVTDLIIDRLVDMQVEEGLPVYVIPLRPLERVLEELRSNSSARFEPPAKALID